MISFKQGMRTLLGVDYFSQNNLNPGTSCPL
jgi:hypothetical protein